MTTPQETPMISVIIPTFNCLAYLPAAIGCVKAQMVPNIELIILDDGSTDDSWSYLVSRQAELPWLKLLKGGGLGPSEARNVALRAAQGQFIAFLDADDVWRVGKLAAQLEFHLQNPDVVLSFTDYEHIDVDGHTFGTCYEYWPRFRRALTGQHGYRVLPANAPAMIFAENVIGTSTAMVRRDVLLAEGAFSSNLHSAEDWDLWLRLAQRGPMGCTDAVAVNYLIRRPGSVTRNADLRLSCLRQIIDKFRPQIAAMDAEAVRYADARYHICAAEYARESQSWLRALQHHLAAWMRVPSMRTFKAAASDAVNVLRRLIKRG